MRFRDRPCRRPLVMRLVRFQLSPVAVFGMAFTESLSLTDKVSPSRDFNPHEPVLAAESGFNDGKGHRFCENLPIVSDLELFGRPCRGDKTKSADRKEQEVQYAILIYASEGFFERLPEEQQEAAMDRHRALQQEHGEKGTLGAVAKLMDTSAAMTIRKPG